MFKEYILTKWTFVPLFGSIAITIIRLIFHVKTLRKIKGPPEKTLVINAETIRNPSNAAITVSGLLIPLVCGLIASFVKDGVVGPMLGPFASSILLLTFAVIVGLWNLFSLTTADGQQTLTITPNNNTTLIPFFLLQVCLLFGGVLVLVIHFLFTFQISGGSTKSDLADTAVFIGRPPARIGMKTSDLLSAWGAPVTKSATNGVEWRYGAVNSTFKILIKDDAVVGIEEHKR